MVLKPALSHWNRYEYCMLNCLQISTQVVSGSVTYTSWCSRGSFLKQMVPAVPLGKTNIYSVARVHVAEGQRGEIQKNTTPQGSIKCLLF